MVRTSRKLYTFGQWVVTTYGLENTKTPYAIEKKRLAEDDWTDHIAGKKPEWDVHNFARALQKARELHRIVPDGPERGWSFVERICGRSTWGEEGEREERRRNR